MNFTASDRFGLAFSLDQNRNPYVGRGISYYKMSLGVKDIHISAWRTHRYKIACDRLKGRDEASDPCKGKLSYGLCVKTDTDLVAA